MKQPLVDVKYVEKGYHTTCQDCKLSPSLYRLSAGAAMNFYCEECMIEAYFRAIDA